MKEMLEKLRESVCDDCHYRYIYKTEEALRESRCDVCRKMEQFDALDEKVDELARLTEVLEKELTAMLAHINEMRGNADVDEDGCGDCPVKLNICKTCGSYLPGDEVGTLNEHGWCDDMGRVNYDEYCSRWKPYDETEDEEVCEACRIRFDAEEDRH